MKLYFGFPFLGIGGETKTEIGLQLTDRVIRIVELRRDKKPLWEPLEVAIEGKNKEDVLKGIVQKYKLSGKKVSACVPVNEGLLKFYKYPTNISEKDLNSAIEWSIKRERVSIKEDIYYDYFILEPVAKSNQLGVVVVFTRKETVEGIRNMLNRTGLRLHVLDYEIVSIVNYGLYHRLPLPFSILYIDYDYSILTTYSATNLAYSQIPWNFLDYLNKGDEESFEHFVTELRNVIVLNDITSLYIAGPVLSYEDLVGKMMENVPILGLLDLEGLKPEFFIPYTLSIRGMEE
ncbi:MAG: type IV pilus biogenesis protein PilM [Aquificaceae bacterium]